MKRIHLFLCAIAVPAGCLSAIADEQPLYSGVAMRLSHDGSSIVRKLESCLLKHIWD